MTKPFGKIYEQTFTGSMVGAGPVVFALWSYVVAHVRPPGVVELNPKLLAPIIGTTEDEIHKALDVLTSEDPDSRTPDHGGRRLLREGQFTYQVPTFERYRNGTDDERKAANAARQKRYRDKHAGKNGKKKPRSTLKTESQLLAYERNGIDPLDIDSHDS